MNLGDFNIKNIEKDLLQSKVLSNFVNDFMTKLKEHLEKMDNKNAINVNKENKYSNYWNYQNFMEDNVAATIGLSRWSTDISYSNELSKAVDNSILEISEKEAERLFPNENIIVGAMDEADEELIQNFFEDVLEYEINYRKSSKNI